MAVDFYSAGAATELSGRLEDADFGAGGAQLNGRREAGPAAADDRDFQARIQVRQAIHSLRSGGSEMRWRNTWQPSRLISSSRVR